MIDFIKVIADRAAAELPSYTMTSCTKDCAQFESENGVFKIQYSSAAKTIDLMRGEDFDNLSKTLSYLYDPEDGEDERRLADSIASEFVDALMVKPKPAARNRVVKESTSTDETDAVYFVNRIPGVLPECREPLIEHKKHYETVLPENFCSEVVNAAVINMLRKGGEKDKLKKFCDLLSSSYSDGNLDTKSIIVQTILNNITRDSDISYVEGMLSDDLRRSWASGRKTIGKTYKPEKEKSISKLAAIRAEALNGRR